MLVRIIITVGSLVILSARINLEVMISNVMACGRSCETVGGGVVGGVVLARDLFEGEKPCWVV